MEKDDIIGESRSRNILRFLGDEYMGHKVDSIIDGYKEMMCRPRNIYLQEVIDDVIKESEPETEDFYSALSRLEERSDIEKHLSIAQAEQERMDQGYISEKNRLIKLQKQFEHQRYKRLLDIIDYEFGEEL
ncbi:MAG: hypothetical protein ACLFPQ_02270 [Candidatus Woesearchaeota archaeon]